MIKNVKTWWCISGKRQHNFGDIITKILLEKLSDYRIEMTTDIINNDIFGIGSILHRCNSSYSGTVWTSGFKWDTDSCNIPTANVIGVRGQLSLDRLNCTNKDNVILGDGGLLIDSLLINRKPNKLYTLGLIPHYVDVDHPIISKQATNKNVKIINILGDYQDTIDQASQCQFILSSSLHGLILADSLNIPNMWIELSDKVQGRGFKFQDYYSVFNMSNNKPYDICSKTTLKDILTDFENYNYNREGIESIKRNLIESIKLI